MLRIAICDDNIKVIAQIRKLVESELAPRNPEISEYTSPTALLRSLGGDSDALDIALLDIQMPELDGISLAAELNALSPDCKIIYISGYADYATEVYDTEHIYYVLKTQLEEKLPRALAKAVAGLGSAPSFMLVKSGTSVTKLPLRRVLYLERNLHKTIVVTSEDTIVTGQSPADLLSTVNEGCFIHCHQSYWVNTAAIQSMGASSFKLISGEEIPISRAKKAEAKEKFFRSLTE